MSAPANPGGACVAVLGAAGTIGPAIVRDLAESEEVSWLELLDLDAARLEGVAADHGAGKAEFRTLDGGAEALGEAVRGACGRGADVLVNAASYRINLDAMGAALAAGSHYLDLGGLYWMTDRQLRLDAEFRAAGLLGVLGIGASPGKTNVMAARAVAELDEPVVSIDVVSAGGDLGARPDAPPVFPYSLQTILDELILKPVVIRDGEPVELEPLADGGTVELPAPVGRVETIYTLHSEMRTFPASFGCREAGFRLSLAPAVLERVRELIGAEPDEVAAAAATNPPQSPRTIAVHRVWAEGERDRVTVTAISQPMAAWGMGGGVVSTAAPAAATVRMLARGEIGARGALPPERCVDPAALLAELERRNCRFTVEHAEPVGSGT